MRVLLLAAGMGSRLGGSIPKILNEAGGMTILQRHLCSLNNVGIGSDCVTVVTGYRRDLLETACRYAGFSSVFNPCWRFPGTLGSFCSLPPSCDDLLLVIHGDLLWEPELISGLFDVSGDIVLPVDPLGRLDHEAMKVESRKGILLHLSKTLPASRSTGESMGVFLIRTHRKLHDLVKPLLHKPNASLDNGVNLALGRMEAKVHFNSGTRWEEVDTPDDLERARKMFRE